MHNLCFVMKIIEFFTLLTTLSICFAKNLTEHILLQVCEFTKCPLNDYH